MYHVTLLYKNSISTLVGLNIPCLGRSKQTLCWGGGQRQFFWGDQFYALGTGAFIHERNLW